tara:strand:+ start:102 stop:254 length:153 start_codon:yes stop_codon:yes gene_type:complete
VGSSFLVLCEVGDNENVSGTILPSSGTLANLEDDISACPGYSVLGNIKSS